MLQEYVKKTIENHIATIEFFYPEHNALPRSILTNLAHTITAVGHNSDVKVVVLKSGGNKTFCAGASFQELININDAAAGKDFFLGFAQVINAMRKCPKFIIGRVQGKAVGGGVGIVAATDYCLATKFAAVKYSELSIGIGPFVVAPAIERKIGLAAFSQMALDAHLFYEASWAKEKGLFAQVFDDIDQMDIALQHLAQQLCTYSPEAMQEMKKMFWTGTEHWDELLIERATISGKLVISKFSQKALDSYKY
ncbi:MAG TPA: enoyl-CoA hydratase [Flavobacterium sp.]|nr:enoyl-CoA hydratase [Flavobacterium sp.]